MKFIVSMYVCDTVFVGGTYHLHYGAQLSRSYQLERSLRCQSGKGSSHGCCYFMCIHTQGFKQTMGALKSLPPPPLFFLLFFSLLLLTEFFFIKNDQHNVVKNIASWFVKKIPTLILNQYFLVLSFNSNCNRLSKFHQIISCIVRNSPFSCAKRFFVTLPNVSLVKKSCMNSAYTVYGSVTLCVCLCVRV